MKKYLLLIMLCALVVSGCKTVAIRYKPNEKGKMIAVEKMEIRGVGKNEADFKAQKIKNDSGFKVPFGNTELSDLPSPNVN